MLMTGQVCRTTKQDHFVALGCGEMDVGTQIALVVLYHTLQV